MEAPDSAPCQSQERPAEPLDQALISTSALSARKLSLGPWWQPSGEQGSWDMLIWVRRGAVTP